MATFFGEILPVISRAVDDDDDECEESFSSFTCLRLSPKILSEIAASKDKKISCKTLLIAIGTAATSFLKTYVLMKYETELVGVIWSGLRDQSANSFSQLAALDESCFVHRLCEKRAILAVECRTDVLPEETFSWTSQLLQLLRTEETQVLVLGSQSGCLGDGEGVEGDAPALRALRTTAFHGTPVCPYLEAPHTVTGLAAQVMTHCQIHQLAAVLYMCYTRNINLDLESINIFKKLLSATPLRGIAVNMSSEEELAAVAALQKLISLHTSRNSIYI